MKFTVIGNGKTGSCVSDLLPKENCLAVCDSKNKPTLDVLQRADASIIFVPAPVMEDLIPLLLEAKRPIVSGATNVNWPKGLSESLSELGIPWITANNFSLTMNMFFYLTDKINKSLRLIDPTTFTIAETHHKSKIDKPSGTSKKIQSLLTHTHAPITSERIGDHTGAHTITMQHKSEKIILTHTTQDRLAYAEGAIWAATDLLWHPHLKGLIQFEDIIHKLFIQNEEKD